MQFPAPRNEEGIGVARVVDAQRDVGQHLLREAIAQVPRRHVLAVAAGKRRRVHLEVHRQRRLVDDDRRERLGGFQRSERRADRELVDPGDEHDVARLRGLDGYALHTGEREDLRDPRLDGSLPVRERAVEHRDLLRRRETSATNPSDPEATYVARVVQRRDLELQRLVGIANRRGNVRQDRLEQRTHVAVRGCRMGLRHLHVERRPAIQRRRVDDRKVELVFGRADPVEELERLVDHPFRPRAGPVDLVHDDDRRESQLQRLERHEPRLRHRTFDGVDQEQHAVDHPQHALDLAAEVGVAGRVDDVDVGAQSLAGSGSSSSWRGS